MSAVRRNGLAYRFAYAFEKNRPAQVRRCWVGLRFLRNAFILAILLAALGVIAVNYQTVAMIIWWVAQAVGIFVGALLAAAVVCVVYFGGAYVLTEMASRAWARMSNTAPYRKAYANLCAMRDQLCPIRQVV
jgi:hypothetical protein